MNELKEELRMTARFLLNKGFKSASRQILKAEARIAELEGKLAAKQDAIEQMGVAMTESPWISVEDRLPELGLYILAADEDVMCACARVEPGKYECLEGGEALLWEPTHWQPLPPPPEV